MRDILGAVFAAVDLVERIYVGKRGTEKRQAAIELVEAATVVSGVEMAQHEIVRVGHLIDSVVGILNKSGIFKRSSKAGKGGEK